MAEAMGSVVNAHPPYLGHISQFELALALRNMVSRRLARFAGYRTRPDLDPSALLTDEERPGACILAMKSLPHTTPKIRNGIRQIVMLDGILGRGSDGEPWVKTLWLGLKHFRNFVVRNKMCGQILLNQLFVKAAEHTEFSIST